MQLPLTPSPTHSVITQCSVSYTHLDVYKRQEQIDTNLINKYLLNFFLKQRNNATIQPYAVLSIDLNKYKICKIIISLG